MIYSFSVNVMKIKLKKVKNNAIIPTRGTTQAAGYDLYSCMDENGEIIIKPKTNQMIHTGIALEIPEGYYSAIFARSGAASKQGLRPANCTGVIDSDYRGEYMVPLYNDSNEDRIIKHGERIAQVVVMPYLEVEFEEVENLNETQRGANGFGSTGKN